MKNTCPNPRASQALLICLVFAGCSSTSFTESANYRQGTAVVPAAVAHFSHESSVARLSAPKEAGPAELPKAGIKLVQAEMLPSPIELPAPALPEMPGEQKMGINFANALAMASGQNPRVGFAQAQIAEAFGRLLAADVLWLPSIQYGLSYNKHEGPLQETAGGITEVNRNSLNAGLGMGAVGSGAPRIPGVWANFRLSDAVFQPHVFRNEANARQAAFSATVNDTLLEASLSYLDLLEAYQARAITVETLEHAKTLAKLTENFLKAGLGNKPDAERAKTELAIRLNEVERANETIRVNAARLAEVLSIRQGVFLEPQEPTIVPIQLVPAEAPLPELIPAALANRPELAESRFLVNAAVAALRKEKFAPLLPSVALGVSAGTFGGGVENTTDNFNGRFDFDGIIYWELRSLGFGEVAARKQMAARARQARFHEVQIMDKVAREVAEDYARVQSRGRQITIAEVAVAAAKESYKLNLERIQKGAAVNIIPLETLQSLQALDQARREYLRALTEYNRAQFRLYRDLGWPIKD